MNTENFVFTIEIENGLASVRISRKDYVIIAEFNELNSKQTDEIMQGFSSVYDILKNLENQNETK